jgi:hypothetical protein
MNNRPRSLIVLILLLSLFRYTPTVVLAQAAGSNSVTDPWGTVKATSPGTELEVKLNDGKKLKGRLLEVSDTTLRLSRKDEIIGLDRVNILKVYQLSPRSDGFMRFATSTGATLGAGVGVAAGLSSLFRGPGFHGPSPRFILLPIAGAALGGIGGRVIAGRLKSRMLIYDSGQRPRVAANSPGSDKP